jgi:hypothetical protein
MTEELMGFIVVRMAPPPSAVFSPAEKKYGGPLLDHRDGQ